MEVLAMWHRLARLTPSPWMALIAVAALGLVALGIVMAAAAMRGNSAGRTSDSLDAPRTADIPPMDRETPDRVETATFALG